MYVKYDSGFALFEAEEYDAEGQKEAIDPEEPREPGMDLGEAEAADAVRFGRPKEVLDNIPLVSNAEVIKTGEDELQIDFELENVGLCTFAVRIGEEFVLQDEAFVDSTKIEWTASTADGETIFPYMSDHTQSDGGRIVSSFGNMVYNRIIACFPEEIRREGTGNQAA